MDIKQFNKNTRYDYWPRWQRRKFTKENKNAKPVRLRLIKPSAEKRLMAHSHR